MRSIRCVAVCLVSSLVVACAPSMALAALESGTIELGVDAMMLHSSYTYDGEDVATRTDVTLALGLGYCVTNLVELKGGLTFTRASVDPEVGDSSSASAFGALAGVALNFGSDGPVVPYVQGSIGILTYGGDAYEDPEASLILPRVTGGVRFLVGDSASVNCGAFWQRLSNAEGVEDLDASQFGLTIGTSLLF